MEVLNRVNLFVRRGHLYHRDVDAHGLLEAEQLCGRPVLRRGEILLHLC